MSPATPAWLPPGATEGSSPDLEPARPRPAHHLPVVGAHPAEDGHGCHCVTLTVPDMLDRQDIRTVTARICDTPGVIAVEVHQATHQVHVEGTMEPGAVDAAVERAGYRVTAVD